MQNQATYLEQVHHAEVEQQQLTRTIFELSEQIDAHKDRLKVIRAFVQGVNIGAGAKGEEIEQAKGDQA